MGVVYRARQDLTRKQVALKVVRAAQEHPEHMERFLDEIRLLGRLDHHGLVAIHDADLHHCTDGDDALFFTMDLIDGVPITTWAEHHSLDRAGRLALMVRVCEAMQYAHDHNVIHCDLKPGNILVRPNGDPVIIDFGLAYLRRDAARSHLIEPPAVDDPDSIGRECAGTPPYMSPEQFHGGVHEVRAGQSVDVYAIGVVTFQLLTGRLPYPLPPSPTWAEARRVVLFTPAHRLRDFLPDVDPELDRVVAKALRKDPADRYFSVTQFLRALTRFLPAATPSREPAWQPATGLVIPSTNWVLDERLGEGAVGEVWTCHHRTLNHKRIVKFCADEEKASFLRRELTLYRLLKEKVGQNPHFARLEEVALDEPPRYLMSEYIEARDLSKWLAACRESGPLPEEAILEIVAQTADALQAAHDAGVLHRDIKPSNIFLRGTPHDLASLHVWVGDFGIGQVISEEVLGDTTRSGFTRTLLGKGHSSYSGTHFYMAPELLGGGQASVRSDIYALGVVLYQALTGDFQRVVTIDWAADVPDPLLRSDLERCFARNPASRFPSAAELAHNLRHLPERREEQLRAAREAALRERRAYRRGLARAGALAAAVVAVVGTLAAYGFHQSNKAEREQMKNRLSTVQALRQSDTDDRQSKAWNELVEVAKRCPPDMKDRLLEEAIAVKALPVIAMEPTPSLQPSGPLWLSPSFSVAGSVEPDHTIRLHQRQDNQWKPADRPPLPPLDDAARQLVVSDTGNTVAAVLQKDDSVWLHFRDRWRPTGGATPTALAVADPAVAAVARPDGTIEIHRGDRAEEAPLILGSGKAAPGALVPAKSAQPPWPQSRPAGTLAFDPQAKHLAAASPSSLLLLLWNTTTGELEAVAEHRHAVTAITWNPVVTTATPTFRSPDLLRALATGSEDGTVTLWETTPRFRRNAETEGGSPYPASTRFLTATARLPAPTPSSGAVRHLAFASVGQLLALYQNNTLALFDCQSGGLIDVTTVPENAATLAIGPDRHLGIQKNDGTCAAFHPTAPPAFEELHVFFQSVTAVHSDTDGRLLLARGEDGAALIDGIRLRPFQRLNPAFGRRAQINPGNDFLIALGGSKLLVWSRIWNEAQPQELTYHREADLPEPDVMDFDAILWEHNVRLGAYAVNNALHFRTSRNDPSGDASIPALPEGATIARHRFHPKSGAVAVIAKEPLAPRLVDYLSRSVTVLNLPEKMYLDVAFSPDGRFLALRDAKVIHVLAGPDWTPLFPAIELPALPESPGPIAFNAQTSLLAATDEDGLIVLYNIPPDGTTAWPPITRLIEPRQREITALNFGGPGRCYLLAGTSDGYLQVWNFEVIGSALASLKENSTHPAIDWPGPSPQWPVDLRPWEAVHLTSDQ
jgi:serine/threonine protein kinase/WD40 repeat protein